MKYEVWQKEGTFREAWYYRGHDYEEERLGIFLQVIFGFDPQGAVGAYRDKYSVCYITDEGRIGVRELNMVFLKPIE